MAFIHRPMQPKDVAECVRVVAAHAVIGARYGDAIADVRPAWLRLLACEAKCAIVFEVVEGGNTKIWAVGVSVFVSDDFLRELKTPPFFWIGPELTKRAARGYSPVLSDRQLQQANSLSGLNVVVWEACILPEYLVRPEVASRMMVTFLEEHRGYLIKEAIGAQASSAEHLRMLIGTGSLLINSQGVYAAPCVEDEVEFVKRPHVVGLTRERALKQHGSWAGTLFLYQPPKCGFSRSAQRLLIAAQAGGTDEELSDQLGISLSAVKSAWHSIYDRVAASIPELIADSPPSDEERAGRGKEKRQRLLAYLREHPEELRPVSRRLLQESASAKTFSPQSGSIAGEF